MDKRDSFIFYRSFFEAITDVNPEDQAAVFRAICEYALNGKIIRLKGVPSAIFKLIRPQLDANQKRYENGKGGGRPRKINKNEETEQKPNKNQKETKTKPNVNVNVNVNENVNGSSVSNKNSDSIKAKTEPKPNDTPHDTHARPTFEEVTAEIYLQRYGIDDASAEEFLKYNDRLGWRMDWREALAKWNEQEARRKSASKPPAPKRQTYVPFDHERKDNDYDSLQKELARKTREAVKARLQGASDG